MADMAGRIVQIRATADPKVVELKPDPELRFIMGRFTPARWSEERHAYLLPITQRLAWDTFARVHSLTTVHVFEKRPSPSSTGPALSPETVAAMAEVERLRAKPDQLVAATRRGVALCRIVLMGAKLRAERKRSGSA